MRSEKVEKYDVIGRANLKSMLNSRGYMPTLKILSIKTAITQQDIQNYIDNNGSLKIWQLQRIANYFKVSLCWLLTNEEYKQ